MTAAASMVPPRERAAPALAPAPAAPELDLPVAWFDWLTWPALVAGGVAATAALVPRLSPTLVTVILTTGMLAVLLVLERVRPQRAPAPRGEPLAADVGHALVGLELGGALGYGGAAALAVALAGSTDGAGAWPTAWPLAAQVVVGLLVVDVLGYVHHRLFHRVGALWPMHALHHQPRALDVWKTGRFHLVDLATFSFVAYLPLLALGAPAVTLAWVVSLGFIAGILQHANVRLPTPAWLDALVCTPAAHWRHHGRDRADDGNFATMCMLIDRALGTWVPTGGRRPPRLGLEDDPLPPGWLPSLVAPFRRRRPAPGGQA